MRLRAAGLLFVAVAAACAACAGHRSSQRATVPNGQESIYPFLSAGSVKVADGMLGDSWDLGKRYPAAQLPARLTWTEDPFHDHYWRFVFYGFRPLSNLVFAYYTTGEAKYKDKLLQILDGYCAYDATRGDEPDTFDDLHASAFRLMMLVNVYGKLTASRDMPPDLEPKLRASIEKLGNFELDPKHFQDHQNHGFNQAAALLVAAVNFADLPNAGAWHDTAIARLSSLLTTTVDPDGVEVENSPFYHFYVLSAAMADAEWAKKWRVELPADFLARTSAMLRYGALVVQPNERVPLLGSSVDFDLAELDAHVFTDDEIVALPDGVLQDPLFQFIRSRGASGTEPADRNVVFGASGQGVLRSGFGKGDAFPQETHVTFNTGAVRSKHNHYDALAVNYYSAGRVLLPDSGLGTYEQGPDNDYFWSTRAHNTVVVDGADQAHDPVGEAVVTTGLVASGEDPARWAYQSGRHSLYPGVVHRRSVVLLERDLLLVVDQLESEQAHTYTQTWHFSPDASIRRVGDLDLDAIADDGQPMVTLHQAVTEGVTVATVKGQTSPIMQGFVSSAYGKYTPSWAAEYSVSRAAEGCRFVTLIQSGPHAGVRADVASRFSAGRLDVSVCAAAAKYVVRVDHQADEAEAVTVDAGRCDAP